MNNGNYTNDNLLANAERLYASGFYDECANNVRKVCERHVDDILDLKGIRVYTEDGSQPNLKDKIDALNANMKLPESYIKILHYVRMVGNKGSHEQNSVTREEAENAIRYMKTILERVNPVIQAAQQRTAYQSSIDNNTSIDNENKIKAASIIMIILLIPGVLLCFGSIISGFFTKGEYVLKVFAIGFGMCFIGALVKSYLMYLIKSEDYGSKTSAVISMLTDDRISCDNSRHFQQEQFRQQNDLFQQEQIRQQNEWAMNETMKAGTPMSMGGYMPDNTFNNLGNGF